MSPFVTKLGIASAAALACFTAGSISRPAMVSLRNQMRTGDAAGKPGDPNHYERRRSLFEAIGSTEPIVFLGDSRIELAAWSELLGRHDISNRGINGDTTTGLLDRLDVSTSPKASTYVLQIGVNDLSAGITPGNLGAKLDTIAASLQERGGITILLTSIIHTSGTAAHLNGKITEANRLFEKVAETRCLKWVDLDLALNSAGALDQRFTNDGIHLNGAGYRRFSEEVATALASSHTAGK